MNYNSLTFIIIFIKANSADYQGVLSFANRTTKSGKEVNWTAPFICCENSYYYQGNDYFILGIFFGENDRRIGAWCDTKGDKYDKHFYICEGKLK